MVGKKSTVPYQVVRSRRKTVAVQIYPDGTVLVRCPLRMRAEDVDRFVASKSGWIEKQLAKLAASPQLPAFTEEALQDLARQAREVIPERVAHYAPLVGVTCERITVRTQRTRWGSCSGKGNLNFNCLLMLTPPEVLDYVVVHELCHRKHMNHSRQFWQEVERVIPDYKVSRTWLKEHGTELIGRLRP